MPPSAPNGPRATVLITTKNRKDDLRRAIASALNQSPAVEVLVIDDGSSDGTAEMVQREFPSVHLKQCESSAGYIVRRNEGVSLASTPIVVIIDDDATFSTPHTIAQTLVEFEPSQVGAVSIPFIHHAQTGDMVSDRAPDPKKIYVTSGYVGTAHALCRDVFLKLGGYREFLFHYGEERDYVARLLNAGFVTRLGAADHIDHWVSPIRDHSRHHKYGSRNNILFSWHNVPLPYMPIHWAATNFNIIKMGVRSRHLMWAFKGIWMGHQAIVHEAMRRTPISRRTYRLLRFLQKQPIVALSQIPSQLLPPANSPILRGEP